MQHGVKTDRQSTIEREVGEKKQDKYKKSYEEKKWPDADKTIRRNQRKNLPSKENK